MGQQVAEAPRKDGGGMFLALRASLMHAHAFGIGPSPMSEGGACVRMNVALGLSL